MNLSRVAIGRPIGTLIIYSAVILVGLSALSGLPIDLLPDISFARLTVSTSYPGAGPEEVENLVSRIVEEAVSTVAGVRDVLSTSNEGSSRVTVTFPFGTDLDAAANDLRAALERVRRRLPEGAETPVIFKFDPSQFPIVQMGLVAGGGALSVPELRQLADEQILFRLERVPGVALADAQGGVRRVILVELDQARLRGLAVSERDVLNALAAANLASPAGQVVEGTRTLGLRALSQYRNLGQIRGTAVTVRGRAPILVGDVAAVSEGTEEERGLVRVNSQPGILLSIQRQPGVNTVAVSDAVQREVREINATLSGATIVVIGDNARFIRRSISSVQQALLVGGALVVAVLFIFLRDPRGVLVIATAIPISVIATFAVMFFFGYSLNLMTLGALALGVGMLVDSSIVVLENIFRYREMGRAGKDAAVVGAGEVLSPVLASTLTTIVVFLPIIFLRGEAVTTQLFFQFSAVVIFSLLCALAVSATLTPVLASFLPALKGGEERRWTASLAAAYRGALRWALHHRGAVYLAGALVFVLGLGIYQLLGREVVPQADEGEIFVIAELQVGTQLPLTADTLAVLERTARQVAPEIRDVTLTAGSAGFGGGRTNRGSLRLRLKDRGERDRSTEAVAADLRRRLQVPGGRVSVRASAGSLAVLRFGQTDPIAVEIRGFDLTQSLALGQQVRETLEEIPGVTDASVAREELVPELTVRIDIERAAAFGLTPQQVANALQIAVGGDVATIFRRGGRELDVFVRLREVDRRTPRDVLAVPITTPSGQQISLSQVAALERGVAPASIFRKSRERATTVTAGISGRDFGSVMRDVRDRMARLSVPPGFTITFGEEFEEQQRANRQLTFGFLVALGLVYAVMAVQFEALLEPLLIMGSVPFALTGSFLLLFLTNTTLNIQSLTGLIVLVGIVVNNAIVLLNFILIRHRQEGLPLYEAVVDAAATRLRPVLMTTLTTALGLLPVALALGEGAELQAPLARSVLGGLLVSTLVTLIFIPALYVSTEEFRVRLRQRRVAPARATRPLPVSGAGTNHDAPGVGPPGAAS